METLFKGSGVPGNKPRADSLNDTWRVCEQEPVLMVRTGASTGSQMTPDANPISLLSSLQSPCCSVSWGKRFLPHTLDSWIQKTSQLPHVPISLLKVHWDPGHCVCLPKQCPIPGHPAEGACGCQKQPALGDCMHQRDHRVLVHSRMLHAPAAALVGFLVGSSLQAHSLALLPAALTQ